MRNICLMLCVFVLEYSLTSSVTFSPHFSSLFLIDLSCSRSEIKLDGKTDCERTEIKAFVAEWLRCQAVNL